MLGAEAEVSREAGQCIHALRVDGVLLRECASLARGRLAQVVAAYGAEFGPAFLDAGELANDACGFGCHRRFGFEPAQLLHGREGFQQHILLGAEQDAGLRGFLRFGRADARADGAAVDKAHARFGIDRVVALTAVTQLCAAARGSDLEAGPARAARRMGVVACGFEGGASPEYVGVLAEHGVERVEQPGLDLFVRQRGGR